MFPDLKTKMKEDTEEKEEEEETKLKLIMIVYILFVQFAFLDVLMRKMERKRNQYHIG